ncbi:phospholipid phosphatase 2 isoform X1 [Spodoptera frugiperda]|uniref:Phospholipid phosphatase 2 isoform X1 n=1 Tax=Spodoptera frugiperda TaxID=7108 RepID=A0A9R0D092_SPOFR|nr:phospholipid phosphatase 2 isoform X1 [Spodoptera frugiperda]
MGVFECVSATKMAPTESTEVFTISTASTETINGNVTMRRDVESQSSSKTSFCTRHGLWWTFGIDIPLLLILLALIGLFELGVIPNHKAGFYCNDPALNFPFNGDTVTTEILMSTLLAGPLVFFAITEYIFVYVDYSESRIRRTCINTFYLYRTYIYGLIMNLSIVEVMKGIVGSPRPTFFDLCEPDAGKTCNGTEYVKDFKCTSTKYASWYQMDSYRSFPSGHTSLSVYCGLFLAWYLQRRAFNWSHRSIFMVPMLQLLCISYAAVCSLTRITDHRHHWWDVLVGSIIGLATVLYAVIISSNFSYDHSKIGDLKSQESRQTVRTLLYDERRPATVS